MDLGDFANYKANNRNAEAAAKAAEAAKENSRKIQRLQNSIDQQQKEQKREKDIARGLYNLSIELTEDLGVLEYEPTEENSLAIANKYLRNSPEELLDPNNHSNLEYKKLATDTSDIYFRLEQNAWFKWAAARVADQMALENAEKERIQAQKDAQAKALKAYNEKDSEKNNYGCVAFVLLIIAGVFFIADPGAAMCPGTIGLICFCVWAYRYYHLPPPPSV